MSEFKPILFANLEEVQRKDIKFLEQHVAWYAENTVEGVNHPEYQRYHQSVQKLLAWNAKEKKKEIEQARKEEEKKERLEKISRSIKDTIEADQCYYVATEDKIYEQNKFTGKYDAMTPLAWCRFHAIPVDKRTLEEVFESFLELGHTKKFTTFTYGNCNPDLLNLADKSHWLQPAGGFSDEDRFWFDLLLDSVSGENTQVRDHIEQCLVYKYLHPEEHRIPMWLPYGASGAGKNEFVSGPIKSIWGEAVVVTDREGVFGSWTGHLMGKMFVMIDETGIGQGDFNALKKLIGNEFTDYNFKGGAKLVGVRNYAMYMMTSNDPTCPIKLTDSPIDRRFSVWKLSRSIIDILGDRKGIPASGSDSDPDKQKLLQMWSDNKHRLSDRNAAAGWLHELIGKWGSMTKAPERFRPDDLEQAIEDKKGPFETSLDDVFAWSRFSYISFDTLYQRYKSISRADAPAQRPKGKTSFIAEAKAYMTKYFPDVETTQVKMYSDSKGTESKSTNVFIRNTCISDGNRKVDTRNDYLDLEGKHLTLWEADGAVEKAYNKRFMSIVSPLDKTGGG